VKRHWLAVLALLITASAWGATFVLVKSLIARIAPEPFIFWRFTTAGVILIVVALARRRLTRAMLVPGMILGVFVFAGYWAQTRGLITISPSRSAFLTGLYVVLVPFFERDTGRKHVYKWIAAILAVVGTTLLIGDIKSARIAIGDWLTLGCAVIFALHVVYSAKWSTRETSTGLAAVQVLFVGLLAAPLALISKPTPWTPAIILAILFTAIVTTALAFAALMWGQARVSATEAAVILSFEPVAAAITSIAFYGEPLTATFLIGALFILAAMVISQL
jgi:drug/metabolite transporter (DMT)-like permease